MTVAFLAVLAIWYPFGLSLGGLIEEWELISIIINHPDQWNSFPGNVMSSDFSARPLQFTVFWLAHLISPNSFLGFHILLLVACMLRVVSGIAIGRFLFGRPIHAIVFGLLAFVFPADTQQIAFRTLSINCSLALMLAGVATIGAAIDDRNALRRWSLVLTSIASSICASWIYEPSFMLYIVPPLLLYARGGVAGATRIAKQRSRELSAWLIGPTINAAYLYYAIHVLKSGYQVSSAPNGVLQSALHDLHYLFDSLAFRLCFNAWTSAFDVIHRISTWPYFVLILGVIAIGLWLISQRMERTLDWRFALRLIIVGIIITIAAYFPFMVQEDHMRIIQRTMMASQFGAAIVFSVIIFFVAGSCRIPLVVASALLLFAGIVVQIYQMDTYTRLYVSVVRPYMSMIADRADTTKPVHLVIDRTGYAAFLNAMYFSNVAVGPGVRLNRFDQLYILCMDEPKTAYLNVGQCEKDGNIWKIAQPGGDLQTKTVADVDMLSFDENFDSSYRARKGTWLDLGTFTKKNSLFRQRPDNANWYACEPDSMWGYSNYCRAIGLSDGIFAKVGSHVMNYVLPTAPDASFIFNMSPSHDPYMLRLTIVGEADPAITSEMKLSINGHPLGFRVLNGDRVSGDVIAAPVLSQYLLNGVNSITLTNSSVKAEWRLPITRVSLLPSVWKTAPVFVN